MQSDTIQSLLLAFALTVSASAAAQAPVDDDGNLIGSAERLDDSTSFATGSGDLSNAELEVLVDRVALYPDDLLAIVLPASTYPLQVVEAGRFLEAVEDDPSLKPEEDWDDSIVALINYPEVVELLNEDLDWTYALGEAFIAQQADLLTAVDSFRDRAYAAGNLKTDEYQRVEENDDGIIEIEPVNDDVIYVPYYEPERVVVYQPRPVYRYYANPYPVYYYPYADSWYYDRPFYGVTTAFTIGWVSHSLHVLHHSHYHHPYYGRYYHDRWWYRRPSIQVHNSIYVGNYGRRHYRYGDYWRPRYQHRVRLHGDRVTRSRHYGNRQRDYVRRDRRDRDAGVVSRNRYASGRDTDGNRRIARTNTNRPDASQQRGSRSQSVRRQSSAANNGGTANRRDRQGIQRESRQRQSFARSDSSNLNQRRSSARPNEGGLRRSATVSPRDLRGRGDVQAERRSNRTSSPTVRRSPQSAPRRAAPSRPQAQSRPQSRPSSKPAQRVERRAQPSRNASKPQSSGRSSNKSAPRSSKSNSGKARSQRSKDRGQDRGRRR